MTSFRPDWDTYFLELAYLTSSRATCIRRKVGCVLVDSKNHVVSMGYNGVPTKCDHCMEDVPCMGATAPSGTALNECLAVHAEVNAFLHLTSQDSLTAYLTVSPCISCAKMICNSNVKKVVAGEWYVHNEVNGMLRKAGIELEVKRLKNVSNSTELQSNSR